MVPAHGLEPRFAASKADVLPLDEAGILRLIRTLLAALCLAFLVSCTTVKSGHCGPFQYNPPSQAQIDAMDDTEKARALAELMKFERICGS